MLQELVIKDFAIIEKANIDFQSKMTVLTGETGAGKSIIIDALGLLAGGRGSVDFIRNGTNKASLQGQFLLPKKTLIFSILDELGIDHEDGTIILQRDLYKTGRNVCRVNGILVNLTTLRKIGELLIDIHGQNEHQSLMRPETHLGLLDDYNHELNKDIDKFHEAFKEYQKLQRALEKRRANEKEWAQRLDILQFQLEEIENADLKPNEEIELNEEKDRLDNYQEIHGALENSYQVLTNGNSDIIGQLGTSMDELGKVSDYSDDLNNIYEKVSDAFYNLQDVSHEISSQLDSMEWDEGRLDQIEQRLELIHQLKRKYGDSVEQIINYGNKIKVELNEMQGGEENIEEQEQEVQNAYSKALKLAQKLSKKRHQSAQELEIAIHKQLSALYMDKAIFKVKFKENKNLTNEGLDDVEFYIQTNPGESMGPLAKIASGGELSRIMLALKTIFSQKQGVTSIIFDEVDTGVSGRVAQAIAEKISQIAQKSQVLCISHLPQVAAIADHHYFIYKKIINGRTETCVEKLNSKNKIKEIARMLSGSEITELTLEHAKELIKMSDQIKTEF
nr:DNA repair protein RecN [uncultured Ligilactobacillus sp.]